jgi:Activator of Hsp90 ATPase homolog 1-like protein
MPTTTLPEIEDLTLKVNQEIHVQAPIEVTFDTLLEQLGPLNERPDGTSLELKLEAWPGGRWFRDLGDDNGHFWATVQAIKRPTLLELNGPMFMSYPVTNNVQYRLSEENGETVIRFCHAGFGLIQEEHRQNVGKGWGFIHDQVRKRAEGSKGAAATRK